MDKATNTRHLNPSEWRYGSLSMGEMIRGDLSDIYSESDDESCIYEWYASGAGSLRLT